jgi:hypothetical protein
METSIQPALKDNERTVGTHQGRFANKTTANQKEKIRFLLHPSSIPTHYQTVHFDDSEDKGFNSTSHRFSLRAVNTFFYKKKA